MGHCRDQDIAILGHCKGHKYGSGHFDQSKGKYKWVNIKVNIWVNIKVMVHVYGSV